MAILLGVGLVPRAAAAQPLAPLGWASAFADFNADGHADVAVANRAAGNDGSNYRIDVRLSNGHRQSVSFVSAFRSLIVRALDVDNDHDLDLVVMPLLSRDVVAVWFNDGAGHFRKGPDSAVPAQAAAISTAVVAGGGPPLAVAMPTPRRISSALASAPRPPTPLDLRGVALSTSDHNRESRLASNRSPRGPPAHA